MKTNVRKQSSRIGMITCLALASLGICASNQAYADKAIVEADAIWAHGVLYGTIATDTKFTSPPPQTTDIIYAFPLMGQRSVAEAAPGDPDYNGGRWNVMVVSYTADGLDAFDSDGDGALDSSAPELTSAEDVLAAEAAGLITITSANFYFECPLRPTGSR